VTGGARGIGRGIALYLASCGWRVAICYRTSAEDAAAVVRNAEQLGPAAFARHCDLSQPDSAGAFAASVVSEWQRVDALINCAGPIHRVDLLQETPQGWREMFGSNLDSVFFMSQAVAPTMIRQGSGRIVSFGIATGDHVAAQPRIAAHFIAKLGVLALTRSLARELGPHGITVNAISPGFIDSGSADLGELESMTRRIPAGYVGSVEDVVGVVRFLLSDEARYVNGANIHVSGGWGL
jgi:3-oxoacyl-[acyl-carrier protein] reductase